MELVSDICYVIDLKELPTAYPHPLLVRLAIRGFAVVVRHHRPYV